MDRDNLSHFLRACADQIDHGATPDGVIQWTISDIPITYHVRAHVRVADQPDDVGGSWIVGEPETGISLAQITEDRRRDIAHRMREDMSKANPLLGIEALDEMVSEGMFQVEILLAEIETLRSKS